MEHVVIKSFSKDIKDTKIVWNSQQWANCASPSWLPSVMPGNDCVDKGIVVIVIHLEFNKVFVTLPMASSLGS